MNRDAAATLRTLLMIAGGGFLILLAITALTEVF